MQRVLAIVMVVLMAGSGWAAQYNYAIGIHGGFSRLSGDDKNNFPFRKSYGLDFEYRLSDSWRLDFDLSRHLINNDTLDAPKLSLSDDEESASVRFSATRLGIMLDRTLGTIGYKWRLSAGVGGGLLIWRMLDPLSGSQLQAPGVHDASVDFAASEIFVGGQAGMRWGMSERWSLTWRLRADYLSGWGAEFADDVNSSRGRLLASGLLVLGFSFGLSESSWKSEENWSSIPSHWQASAAVDQPVDDQGVAGDSDGDGVADDVDDCPGTEYRARGHVDIHGCPTDSDFDGVPDYIDKCPNNPVGAAVDDVGCPLDSDKDGVPDGLDDCPNTLYGVAVDPNGCIDLSMLSEPMVLNIDYISGSFEIDPRSRERLRKLALTLSLVPAVRLEINGYTDNIGTAVANRELSLKRANRVRDFLVDSGVARSRIKTFGRGEADFVASNQTAAGRAKNRRVEIVFYK